jgi:Tfp pilus assembly protein PilN
MTSPNELSFLPEDYLAKKARRRANILCGALSVVVMGTIGSAFALSERSMRGLDAELADVDARYAEAAGRIEAVKKMHAKQRQIVQQAELAAALVERVPRSNVLATFTNSLPPGVSLLDLAMESKARVPAAAAAGTAFDNRAAALMAAQKKPAAAEAPKQDVFLRLTGVADNDVQVGEFIARLTRSPLLKDVNLVVSDSLGKEKSTLRRFQLEMMVNPAADVTDLGEKRK